MADDGDYAFTRRRRLHLRPALQPPHRRLRVKLPTTSFT